MLTLNDIYIAINKKHPKYDMGEKSWQNSIRHNLSLHKGHFENVPRSFTHGQLRSPWSTEHIGSQKGAYWKLKPGAELEIFKRSKRAYKTFLKENVVPDTQIQNQEILNEELQMKHILEEQADPNSFSYIPPTTQISSIPFQNEDNELVESVLNENVILDTEMWNLDMEEVIIDTNNADLTNFNNLTNFDDLTNFTDLNGATQSALTREKENFQIDFTNIQNQGSLNEKLQINRETPNGKVNVGEREYFDLPYGWTKEVVTLRNQPSMKGKVRTDIYLKSPVIPGIKRKTFRNDNQVHSFLEENPNIMCDLDVTSTKKTKHRELLDK